MRKITKRIIALCCLSSVISTSQVQAFAEPFEDISISNDITTEAPEISFEDFEGIEENKKPSTEGMKFSDDVQEFFNNIGFDYEGFSSQKFDISNKLEFNSTDLKEQYEGLLTDLVIDGYGQDYTLDVTLPEYELDVQSAYKEMWGNEGLASQYNDIDINSLPTFDIDSIYAQAQNVRQELISSSQNQLLNSSTYSGYKDTLSKAQSSFKNNTGIKNPTSITALKDKSVSFKNEIITELNQKYEDVTAKLKEESDKNVYVPVTEKKEEYDYKNDDSFGGIYNGSKVDLTGVKLSSTAEKYLISNKGNVNNTISALQKQAESLAKQGKSYKDISKAIGELQSNKTTLDRAYNNVKDGYKNTIVNSLLGTNSAITEQRTEIKETMRNDFKDKSRSGKGGSF